ncbi:GNAT family N-acetyltransferase [Paenibacillus sp. N3/727]|uniref:GNAT family N-acetyltransferase n=1 Tax=Paenibacillus sp. N3/727 TaxID=2925845 RepID=UPI001F534FA9|nr:GNAT family N-acetyltransferase [Paenibacillus sp. N3/727]UNK21045.1 GNAT family N-acetyltransferase [Paenibacillus sp. N3/727]
MNIEFKTITESEKTIFENLFNYYLCELSLYSLEEVGPDGKYEMEDIPQYYIDDRLFPYLITVDNNVAGFILVVSPPYVSEGIDYSVQELFVLPKYRGTGIAKKATMHIFKQFKGHYNIGMFRTNTRAVNFWTHLLSSLDVDVQIDADSFVKIAGNELPVMDISFSISEKADL